MIIDYLAAPLSLEFSGGMLKTLQKLKSLAVDIKAVQCSTKRVSELTLSFIAIFR